jgi:hypothetical protein
MDLIIVKYRKVKKLILIAITFLFIFKSYSQTIESDFLVGAWSDTINSKTGEGFIFLPDSCLSFIVDGEMTECIIESQNLKVHYRADLNVSPRQLDIIFIDLKADTIKGIIPMSIEIIDDNNIKLATYKTKSSDRPIDFSSRDDVEIAILTRYRESKK